jgi:hypothetical protein
MMQAALITAVIVIAFLMWVLSKQFSKNRLLRFMGGRRPSSRLVSTGTLVDGSRHIPVALALNESTFYYENSDLQGNLDLHWIQTVEYDDELSTGQSVANGTALRLRCYSQTFEFVLPESVVTRWQLFLPAHGGPLRNAAAVALQPLAHSA